MHQRDHHAVGACHLLQAATDVVHVAGWAAVGAGFVRDFAEAVARVGGDLAVGVGHRVQLAARVVAVGRGADVAHRRGLQAPQGVVGVRGGSPQGIGGAEQAAVAVVLGRPLLAVVAERLPGAAQAVLLHPARHGAAHRVTEDASAPLRQPSGVAGRGLAGHLGRGQREAEVHLFAQAVGHPGQAPRSVVGVVARLSVGRHHAGEQVAVVPGEGGRAGAAGQLQAHGQHVAAGIRGVVGDQVVRVGHSPRSAEAVVVGEADDLA